MASNAARQLTQPTPIITPNQTPTPQTQIKRVPFSAFEKTLITTGALAVFLMMVMVVTTSLTITKQQQSLQDLQTKVAKVKQSNTSDQQEIASLTSQSNLETVAQKYGLSDANSSVRNVNR